MSDEKKIFAEWYSLGAQELSQGTVETRAMLVPGAGVLVQIEARTAGGRNSLAAQWLPGVVIYEGRLVGDKWAERLMQVLTGARPNMVPPLPPPPPLNLIPEGSTKPIEAPPEPKKKLRAALKRIKSADA
jgi:hypothetical protein